MYEPCFDTLRTKEQLGYSAHSGTRRTHGVLALCVVVVSGAAGQGGTGGAGHVVPTAARRAPRWQTASR